MDITPEMQAAIDAAVEKATATLKTKNSDLIKEVRDAKASKKTAEEEADDAKAEAERKAGDITALEKRLTDKFDKERAALVGERDTAMGELKTLKIDNVITKTLVDNNVAPFARDALTAMFKAGATLENGEALYQGAALEVGMKSYLTSDNGKYYVTAPTNSGGGAAGSSITTGDRWSKMSNDLSTWTATDHSEFAQLSTTNPAMFNSVIDSKGLPSEMKV